MFRRGLEFWWIFLLEVLLIIIFNFKIMIYNIFFRLINCKDEKEVNFIE